MGTLVYSALLLQGLVTVFENLAANVKNKCDTIYCDMENSMKIIILTN